MNLPKSLLQKLEIRKQNNALRTLPTANHFIDFSSNDYLGFAKSEVIFNKVHQYLINNQLTQNGATGSRLLTGNHDLYQHTETRIAQFHDAEAALIFNSGYDANVGFFGAVPQRSDVILFDELIHASIRDGIKMSNAKAYKYNHNDYEDLENKIVKLIHNQAEQNIYVVTETVFSMDGDSANVAVLAQLCQQYSCFLVVDEAHALGVFGNRGEGLIQLLGLQNLVFARIVTFGKGLGCHGAVILGSDALKEYLVNFARSLIYTTGLSPHAVATILVGYQLLAENPEALPQLKANIVYFSQQKKMLGLQPLFVRSKSAIQSAIISGNENVKAISLEFQQHGFDIKPILSPTVPEGQERLRICLHSYNTFKEIDMILNLLNKIVFG
jgi:8-amino-7-oxononanoate synthase